MKTIDRQIKVGSVREIVHVKFDCKIDAKNDNRDMEVIIDNKVVYNGTTDNDGYLTADIIAEELGVPLRYYVRVRGAHMPLIEGLINFDTTG